jgi:hypothetical protein
MPELIFRCGFLVLCAFSWWLPLIENNVAIIRPHPQKWPTTWEGKPIRQIPLSTIEQRFNDNFPGQVAKFTDGQRELIFRRVAKATRQLHPSSDCFRGMGYTVIPRAALVDAHGGRWSCFAASRGSIRLLVRERITDQRGREWPDVSAWFWSVLLRQSEGPWLAITIVEKQSS